MDTRKSFWDKVWKDKQGHQAVWQTPNLTLSIWAALTVVRIVMPDDELRQLVDSGARLVLFAWAWMEMLHGDSYFRKALGVIIAGVTLLSLYKLLA